jgi:hypothetical protein
MAGIKSLKVSLGLDIKNFMTNLKIATGELEKSAKKMADSLTNVGKKLSIAITLPATVAGLQFLKLASDANEADDKLKAFYGESAPALEKALKDISNAVGRNATELKNYASHFGEIFNGMKLTEKESANLSEALVKLGLDVASFRNVSDETAMSALASGLMGQTRALKAFGVEIDDNKIKLEAFNMGLSDGKSDLTDQQKLYATLNIYRKEFKKDTNDLIGSQDTYENSLKKMNSQIKTMGEKFGKEMIPYAIQFMKVIEPLIDAFARLKPEFKEFLIIAVGVSAVIPPLLVALGSMINGFIAVKGAVMALSSYMGGTLLATIGMVVLAIGAIVVAVISVIGAWDDLVYAAQIVWEGISSLFKAGTDYVVEAWLGMVKGIGNILKSGWDFIIGIWESLFGEITMTASSAFTFVVNQAKAFVSNVMSALVNIPRMIYNNVVGKVVEYLNFMFDKLNMLENYTGLYFEPIKFDKLKDDFKITFDDMVDISAMSWEAVKSGSKKAFDFVADIAKNSVAKFSENWNRGIDTIKNKLGQLLLTPKGDQAGNAQGSGAVIPDKSQSTFLRDIGADQIGTDADQLVPPVPDIEETKNIWTEWADHIGTVAETVKETMFGLYDTISSGFGNAINGMIFDGVKFGDAMKAMAIDMAKSIISALIKMAVQYVANSLVAIGASKAKGVGEISTAIATTYANTFSSISAIPIIGPAMAPGAASSASSFMAAEAFGMLALAEGGITQGPTNALIGEAGQEAVIPLDRLDSIIGSKEQIIMIHLDGREIAKSVIKHSPREIRLNTGVIM